LPRTATLPTLHIAKEMRYKRPPLLAQQLRQLGDVGGDAPGFVAGEEVGLLHASGFFLEIEIGQRFCLYHLRAPSAC
jgi:hypothetical protein